MVRASTRKDMMHQGGALASHLLALRATSAYLSAPTADGETALHYAVMFNLPSLARFLLQAKANPNAANESGHTPLRWAVAGGNVNVTLAETLLAHHASVHLLTPADRTTLESILPDRSRGRGGTLQTHRHDRGVPLPSSAEKS